MDEYQDIKELLMPRRPLVASDMQAIEAKQSAEEAKVQQFMNHQTKQNP